MQQRYKFFCIQKHFLPYFSQISQINSDKNKRKEASLHTCLFVLLRFYISCKGMSHFFLYPHFGHTPSSFNEIPQRGQRSILFLVSNSAEPAFTPLVNVILAMFNFIFQQSYTILIMPSTVMVSFVTTKRQSGYAVASVVLNASPFILFWGCPFLIPCFS